MDPAINSKEINFSNLSNNEIRQLQEKCEQGDPIAREKIILAHLPLVGKIARSYCYNGVPYEDLYQEGCYGLIKAARNYKCQFNTSFATYSSYYITKYIKKALITQNTLSPITYKEHFFYELQKYVRAFDKFTEKHSRYPSDKELAKTLNVSEKKIKLLRQSAHFFLYYPIYVQPTDMYQYPSSLIANSAEKVYFDYIYGLDLSALPASLTVREREVLSRKFGFTKNGNVETYAQISAAMGLSYETIRNTYLIALKKIRDAIEENDFDSKSFEI